MTGQDATNLASGEYVCKLEGGNDQYRISPRAIEWVVSVTKHLPGHLASVMPLDNANCMGLMRTFDRKAQ
jgi:hypothetical protein